MSKITEIKSPTKGIIGYLHEVDTVDPSSVLIFQLPRQTNMLNNEYIKNAMDAVKSTLPEGRNALIVGGDVNVYELCGADAVVLKLKGLI